MIIYEEVHPLRALASPPVHRVVLQHLAQVLPRPTRPILGTASGFRGTWFRMVEALGWHWVGRIRNRTLVQPSGTPTWHPCKDFYAQATARPCRLGSVSLVRSNPLACPLHLVRQRPKHRKKTAVFGQAVRSSPSQKQAAGEWERWLLGSSLSFHHLVAPQIVALSRHPMQQARNFIFFFFFESDPNPNGVPCSPLFVDANMAFYLIK